MKATVYNADYFGFDPMEFEFPCEIHFTRFGNTATCIDHKYVTNYLHRPIVDKIIEFENKNSFKVFVCNTEPSSSYNRESNKNIIFNGYQYDLIICTEEEVLLNLPNAKFLPYGGTWLNKNKSRHNDSLGVFDESILSDITKQYNISFLTTSHLGKTGYNLRCMIWNKKELIENNTVFYSSTRYPTNDGKFSNTLHDGLLPNDDKIHLYNSMFSIAIESSSEVNYFTEKLIDCLLTKTVPIYWGCPNIGDFFDTRGIIQFESYEDFLEKVNSVNEKTYDKMKKYIDKNYEKAKEYGRDLFRRIEEVIIKEKNNIAKKKDKLLTIGILTLPQRKEKLNNLLNILQKTCPVTFSHRIEIVISEDNKEKSVGTKRNEILDKAKGKYVCFIDDDDIVSKWYLSEILNVLDTDLYDGVGFWGIYYVSGNPVMEFNHSNANGGHFKKDGKQHRPLNHLNPVRTEFARQIKFPEKNFAEDADYCDRLLESKLIKSEYNFNIDKVMYHYLFDPNTTETQK